MIKKLFPLLMVVLVLFGAGCRGSSNVEASQPVALSVWGVFDDEDYFDDVIAAYRQVHPNVSIEYKKFRFEEYEDELVRSIAEGEGPDIFLLHNTWLEGYKDLLLPLPSELTVGYQEVRGGLNKEVVSVLRTEKTTTERKLKDLFVDAVEEDVIMSYQPDEDTAPEDRIFAFPLHMDSLALYWNRDLLNNAGIASPPSTWSEFQDAVTALTEYNSEGEIVQSGAALGTSDNVERAADILGLLMMQNGTQMISEDGDDANFDKIPAELERETLPGLDAVRFYTDFANPTKEVYTWNENQESSFEAFTNGTTAMMFGYAYHLPLVRVGAPKLDFSVSEMPQISGAKQVNFASYWNMGVSKDSENWNWAWDFSQFVTTDEEVNQLYLEASGKPPALRSLIASQVDEEYLSAFAAQVLTAESWYRGNDAISAEGALEDLIDNILNGNLEGSDAIELAAETVEQTL